MDFLLQYYSKLIDSNGQPIAGAAVDYGIWVEYIIQCTGERLFAHIGRYNEIHLCGLTALMLEYLCDLSQFEHLDIMLGSPKFSELYARAAASMKEYYDVDIADCPPFPDLRKELFQKL